MFRDLLYDEIDSIIESLNKPATQEPVKKGKKVKRKTGPYSINSALVIKEVDEEDDKQP